MRDEHGTPGPPQTALFYPTKAEPGQWVVAFNVEMCVMDMYTVLQGKFEHVNYTSSNLVSSRARSR